MMLQMLRTILLMLRMISEMQEEIALCQIILIDMEMDSLQWTIMRMLLMTFLGAPLIQIHSISFQVKVHTLDMILQLMNLE